ncbi:MAG: hypothetical protein JO001_23330 [Alphaproteobacteria bacterium]|nr:hypothetical protein [Alphaproteobacteria bacterium]
MIRSAAALAATLLLATTGLAIAQEKPEATNMRLVGYSDLQGRSAYQPLVHQQFGRWIAYIGHHGGTDEVPQPVNPITGQAEYNGTSLVDVTDPQNPKYLAHIPGEPGNYEAGGAQMVRVCDGKSLPKGDPNAVYLLRPFGNSAQEIWNTTDPSHPKLVTRIVEGLKGTHKNFWECDSGIAYLVTGEPGWRVPRMTQIWDLSDPAHPTKIRDFGLPGQQPNAPGAVPTMLHGMISVPSANRVYFGYGTNDGGIMQIVDREKLLNGPKEPTDDDLRYPEVGRYQMSPLNGAHTAFPMLDVPIAEFAKDKVGKRRNFVVITDEQIKNECQEARQFVWFVDITVENRPVSVATWGVPEASGDFCSRGGRFGTHSSNENMTPIYYKRVMFFAHFNAGLRAVDVRDPYHPKEIASYIPAITERSDKRCATRDDGTEHCAKVIQTNNVEVDDRGYIYIVDRANNGMHILELTGSARDAANFPK